MKPRLILLNTGIAALMLSLSLNGAVIASEDEPGAGTGDNEPGIKESEKKSRLSRLKGKVKKEADKSTVIQSGKKFSQKTGEAAKAVGDVGKAAGKTGMAIGESAIQTAKDKLTSKKQGDDTIVQDEPKKPSGVKEATKNLAEKTGKATKAIKKSASAGVEFQVQTQTAPHRAGIRAGTAITKKVTGRSSKKDKEKETSAEEDKLLKLDPEFIKKNREEELARLSAGKLDKKKQHTPEVVKQQTAGKKIIIGEQRAKYQEEQLNREYEEEKRKLQQELRQAEQEEGQHKPSLNRTKSRSTTKSHLATPEDIDAKQKEPKNVVEELKALGENPIGKLKPLGDRLQKEEAAKKQEAAKKLQAEKKENPPPSAEEMAELRKGAINRVIGNNLKAPKRNQAFKLLDSNEPEDKIIDFLNKNTGKTPEAIKEEIQNEVEKQISFNKNPFESGTQ